MPTSTILPSDRSWVINPSNDPSNPTRYGRTTSSPGVKSHRRQHQRVPPSYSGLIAAGVKSCRRKKSVKWCGCPSIDIPANMEPLIASTSYREHSTYTTPSTSSHVSAIRTFRLSGAPKLDTYGRKRSSLPRMVDTDVCWHTIHAFRTKIAAATLNILGFSFPIGMALPLRCPPSTPKEGQGAYHCPKADSTLTLQHHSILVPRKESLLGGVHHHHYNL